MDEIEVRIVRLCPKCGPTANYDASLNCIACGEHTKEEVISGDVGVVGPPVTQFAEIAVRPEHKRRICREYGKEIADDARFCPYHGANIPDNRVSEGTIIGLAAIGGIFGLHGLGHLILGKLTAGFLVLFAGIALIVGIVLTASYAWWSYEMSLYVLTAILALAYIGLFIWQVTDANASVKKHNRDFENHRVV